MSESVHIAGPVGFLSNSGAAVYFSKSSGAAGAFTGTEGQGTALPVKQMQTALEVAYWGEDNRFPQNIEQQMAYCGIGKAALNWKAQAYWGAGIIPGKIVGYEDEGRKEIFQPLDRATYRRIYSTIEDRRFYRFWMEFLQDWTWYGNCFPEMILSKDCKTITGFVHQESCDSRFKQMNEKGQIDKVYLSKLWGASRDQYAKFDPKKNMKGVAEGVMQNITEVDNKYLKALDCIDMYDPVNSLKEIGERLFESKGADELKSAILPVNFPSVNKTYYQVPGWDGARLGGWVEIACKVPQIIKMLYKKGTRIRYHIEVPETYFELKFGFEAWASMDLPTQLKHRKDLLKEMDNFLTAEENAFSSFVSFFQVAPREHTEYGRIKITEIPNTNAIDKDLITGSAADIQILTAMGVDPTLFGAGTIGTGQQRSGGSDKREAFLIYSAMLNLERQVFLEPLYLMRDFNRSVGGMNEWEDDIVFRFRDTVLTTLDTGKGTTKTVS